MPTVKKYDFVEIEYTGRIKEDGTIFDTTEEKVAKENGTYNKNADYSPAVICVGENNILKNLEEQMIGKETGNEYAFEIISDNAFGRKDAKLIQLIPTSKFRQQNIQPVPGLQLNIDGVFGFVKTVSGGRCMVDFNHPLAGKDLIYNVKINKIIDDSKEKIKSLLKMHLHIKDAEIELGEDSINISLKESMPKQAQEEFKKVVERTIPGIKNVNFTIPQEKNK
ncbi:MAG: peptidylprolyl isomerase [Nanoarchaeota archaeon]